jgi:hypothetical protein
VLERIESERLRVFVAWVPMLEDDIEAALAEAISVLPDQRVTHFWDADGSLQSFQRVLGLGDGIPAWDLYLLYESGTTWEALPPTPTFWMHQLDLGQERFLDVTKLRDALSQLLTSNDRPSVEQT